jgi:exodeoxyribonuclease-3
LEEPEYGFPGQPEWDQAALHAREPRAIGATCGGVRLWSLYVPHGRGQDDPHMEYKLAYLAALADQAAIWASDAEARVALAGDFNVAPLDTDVWDPAAFQGLTHTSARERAAFGRFAGAGYREVTREHVPGRGAYTYWDYQALRFPRDQGMRIDFAWCSPALADAVTGVRIWRDERKGKGPSDHVPVELEIG